jgi:hypothetical protein
MGDFDDDLDHLASELNLVAPHVPSHMQDAYQRGSMVDLAFTVRGLGRFPMNWCGRR